MSIFRDIEKRAKALAGRKGGRGKKARPDFPDFDPSEDPLLDSAVKGALTDRTVMSRIQRVLRSDGFKGIIVYGGSEGLIIEYKGETTRWNIK